MVSPAVKLNHERQTIIISGYHPLSPGEACDARLETTLLGAGRAQPRCATIDVSGKKQQRLCT